MPACPDYTYHLKKEGVHAMFTFCHICDMYFLPPAHVHPTPHWVKAQRKITSLEPYTTFFTANFTF